MSNKKLSNELRKSGIVGGSQFRVVKYRLVGYSVEKDDKLLGSIFRLKKDAINHMNNLKKVADAISKNFDK